MGMKVGFGYDSHKFTESRPLILGGVVIPENPGLQGHSDGDALSHAIADAILGAAGAGDLGSYFPSEDPKWKDCDSLLILKEIVGIIGDAGLKTGNVDVTIVCEKPRISLHREVIIQSLSRTMRIEQKRLSIKSKSNDQMGWIGSGVGMAVYAVTLLETM